MKNFLAIIGCFTLAVVMIVVFASCGNRNHVSVDDPDASVVQEQNGDEATTAEKTDDVTEADNNGTEADEVASEEATNASSGSSFLDTVLDGVEDVVGEALGGAANVVEEALAGAANKVNDKLNNKSE
ncbi:MAG: hypothetical protein IKM24_04530 [Clostridia bacterium]|nr:hypothetical protein [Clostridia bacterium]